MNEWVKEWMNKKTCIYCVQMKKNIGLVLGHEFIFSTNLQVYVCVYIYLFIHTYKIEKIIHWNIFILVWWTNCNLQLCGKIYLESAEETHLKYSTIPFLKAFPTQIFDICTNVISLFRSAESITFSSWIKFCSISIFYTSYFILSKFWFEP